MNAHVETLRELLACCQAWMPEVRVMGNVRADDAAASLQAAIAALEAQGEAVAHKTTGLGIDNPKREVFIPCDCGCGRSCCAFCGTDVGFLAPPSSPTVSVIDAELDDLILRYGNARAHNLMDEAAEIYTQISFRERVSTPSSPAMRAVVEALLQLREWIEKTEVNLGIGACKVEGSFDRNFSNRDNLLLIIDSALAHPEVKKLMEKRNEDQ